LQKAYAHIGYKKGDFPVTERMAEQIVSLPMFPQLRHDQQIAIAGKSDCVRNSKIGAAR